MRDERRALRALDQFYQAGYTILQNQNLSEQPNSRVDGFFVSDSGILFVRSANDEPSRQLVRMLGDNQNGRPRIQPGQCGLTKRNLHEANGNLVSHDHSPLFELLQMNAATTISGMFDQKDIDGFKRYSDAYELKYAGILKALKNRKEF